MTDNERVKYLRESILKLTQKQFIEKLNISQASLSEIENNIYDENDPEKIIKQTNMRASTLKSISKAYNVNLNWLLCGIGDIFMKKEGQSFMLHEPENEYAGKENLDTIFQHLKAIKSHTAEVETLIKLEKVEKLKSDNKVGQKSDKSTTKSKKQ